MKPHALLTPLALLLAAAAPCAAAAGELVRTFDPGVITRLDAEIPVSESLTVSGRPAGVEIKVEFDDAPECKPDLEQDGSRLKLTWSRRGHLHWEHDCDLRVSIAVSAEVSCGIATGAGSASLKDVAAPLELVVGAGDIHGSASSEKLKVRTGAGSVELNGLRAPVDVKTGAGSISLTFAAPFTGGARIATGMGSIEILVPTGTPLQARLTTGMGDVSRDVPTQPTAPMRIEASTGMGSIHLGPI
jgi:hypothetical protein